MVKGKRPFISLLASGRFGSFIRVVQRQRRAVIQASPDPPDAKSLAQLSWRHMYQKAVALWHALSAAEKVSWESAGTARHMTGFAWFMSQCLKPNPGLYLPLQGGTMTGEIVMGGEAISDLPDPGAPQDADTLAAREAAITAALEDCIDSHIHGWDGSAWQKLLTESNTLHNLRVKLYDGANAIGSVPLDTSATTQSGLVTIACLHTRVSANLYNQVGSAYLLTDNRTPPSYGVASGCYLYGFDGTTWDRLRSYGTGTLKVGRAEVGLLTMRRIGTGQVKASAGKLFWIVMNPAAAASIWELSDDVDGSTAIVLDHYDAAREGHMFTFDPPMEFSSGIYLKAFTNMTSMTFGYL